MALSELATLIYRQLRSRVPAEDPRISYQQLVESVQPLPTPYETLQPFDRRLFDALGEIGRACHLHAPSLPAITAIVVQKEDDGRLGMPGPGYFQSTHPTARSENAKVESWLREYQQAKVSHYPPVL
jgi:hypothetical protein